MATCETCATKANLRRILKGEPGTRGGLIVAITHVVELHRPRPGAAARLVHKWLVATVEGDVGVALDEDEDVALTRALQDARVIPR